MSFSEPEAAVAAAVKQKMAEAAKAAAELPQKIEAAARISLPQQNMTGVGASCEVCLTRQSVYIWFVVIAVCSVIAWIMLWRIVGWISQFTGNRGRYAGPPPQGGYQERSPMGGGGGGGNGWQEQQYGQQNSGYGYPPQNHQPRDLRRRY